MFVDYFFKQINLDISKKSYAETMSKKKYLMLPFRYLNNKVFIV